MANSAENGNHRNGESHRSGILVDHEILDAQATGLIRIDPFSEDSLQPATYDLRVGAQAVLSTTSKLVDLSGTRMMIIEPGAMAIVQSLETIKLSMKIAGRIGPKTSLLRRGIFVAVGPQVDPGFEGRMIVNLINLSPRPFAIRGHDTFLSAEFHLLASEPTHGYRGAYQGRTELTTEEVETLLAYQGPTLADMHRGFAEMRDNIREVVALGKDIPRLVEIQEEGISRLVDLRSRIETSAVGIPVPIGTFAPEPYDLIREMTGVLQPTPDGFMASFFDANIHASGETEDEAIQHLKSLILDMFDSLSDERPENLGVEPRRQIDVLRKYLVRQR